jgi:glycosyltransferase involved in cell wall biosynthesis
MSTARVFIGMPVFNGERFLAEAIESHLAQTRGDFTLMIADNASTDATMDICQNYARRDSRVRVFRHASNIGAPRNWNFVVKQADAEYFKWSTCNDLIKPTTLEKSVAALDDNMDAVLVQGRTRLVDEDSGAVSEYQRDLSLEEPTPGQRLLGLASRLSLNNGQSGLIRLAALKITRLERFYPDGDVALMAELALLGKFLVLPEYLFTRRMGSTTFTRMLGAKEKQAFFDPQGGKVRESNLLRLHLDVLRASLGIPMAYRHRFGAILAAMRYLLWHRGDISKELLSQNA